MDENDDDGERTGEGKGPGRPGGDEMQPTQHEADHHRAEQVADDVDEQVDRHDGIAVEVRPERSELRRAAELVDIIGQSVQAHERRPGNPADEGECRRDGGEPGRAPHAQQRHAQVAQGQEEGGSNGADEVQGVAGRTSHRTRDERRERRALISLPGDQVERDRERREEDAGRQADALEGESGGAFRLLCMGSWEFHLVVPFSVLSPYLYSTTYLANAPVRIILLNFLITTVPIHGFIGSVSIKKWSGIADKMLIRGLMTIIQSMPITCTESKHLLSRIHHLDAILTHPLFQQFST
jgi:hypothetical protein